LTIQASGTAKVVPLVFFGGAVFATRKFTLLAAALDGVIHQWRAETTSPPD
jgi:hypothetical protein